MPRTAQHRPSPTRQRQQGLSLVELMVAMVIGLIVLGAVVTMFLNSRQSYVEQQRVASIQESIAFVSDHLRTELRNAQSISLNNGNLAISRDRDSACDGSSSSTNTYAVSGSGTLTCNGQPMVGGDEHFSISAMQIDCFNSGQSALACGNEQAHGISITLAFTAAGQAQSFPITAAIRNRVLQSITANQ